MKKSYEIHIKLFNGNVEKYSQPREWTNKQYDSETDALKDFGIGKGETVIYCEPI